MEAVFDAVLGFVVLMVFVTLVAARLLGTRLLPKREVVLPNQRGVLVQDDCIVRVVAPGACWVRPKQRIVLIDARPKPLQLAGFEVLSSDHAVVRLSLSVEYRVSDSAVYYTSNASASDALFVQLRRAVNAAARQIPGPSITTAPEIFGARILSDIAEPAARLGLEILHLDVYESVGMGFLRPRSEPAVEFPQTGLVH